MDTIALTTEPRDTSRKPGVLRRNDIVPCVLYGNNVENTSVQCDHKTLYKAYAQAGESTVVELEVSGKKVPVLFHNIDFHPVTEKILHADFYAVDMTKKIETSIPLHFNGVAPAVKDLGGMLLAVLDHVTVQCLPADLPHAIDVDISGLETFDDSIHVSDLQVSDKVIIMESEDQVVANVQQPRSSIEEEQAEEAVEGEGESGEGEAAEEEKSE